MASDIAADTVRELGAALTERDRAVREAFIRTEDCHAAIARHAAAEAEVSALRAALEAAETDAQLCRERLGDERERRRAAEALAVPEGWKVEWSWENTTHHGDHTYSAEAVPRLVPLSPTDTPEEA